MQDERDQKVNRPDPFHTSTIKEIHPSGKFEENQDNINSLVEPENNKNPKETPQDNKEAQMEGGQRTNSVWPDNPDPLKREK